MAVPGEESGHLFSPAGPPCQNRRHDRECRLVRITQRGAILKRLPFVDDHAARWLGPGRHRSPRLLGGVGGVIDRLQRKQSLHRRDHQEVVARAEDDVVSRVNAHTRRALVHDDIDLPVHLDIAHPPADEPTRGADSQKIWKDSAEFNGSPPCKSANIGSSREGEGKKAKAIRLLTLGTTSGSGGGERRVESHRTVHPRS
jgi:hypothetical protein